jgi:hypothetical protein
MTKNEIKIWKYLLDNRLATAEEVSKATKVSLKVVRGTMKFIGTSKHVIEKEIKENRLALLQEAIDLTGGDRAKDYGNAVANHQHIAKIFNAITGHDLSARDMALIHTCTKLSRGQTSPKKRDHYVDRMAYAGIEYECVMAEEE